MKTSKISLFVLMAMAIFMIACGNDDDEGVPEGGGGFVPDSIRGK